MTEPPRKANVRVLFALTLVHFTGDFFNAFTTPLLPVFAGAFALSLTEVGIISGLGRFLSFVVQPNVGYFADRHRTRLFILGGILLSVTAIPLTGAAPSYAVLLCLTALGSIGSALFHPSVAGMVYSYAGTRPGFAYSVFNMGGTFAFAVGPLFITWYVSGLGLGAMPWLMVPGLAVLAYLFLAVPVPEGEKMESDTFLGTLREAFGHVWKWIALIWLLMVFRAFVAHVFRTYLPVLYVQEGYSLVAVGAMITLFTLAGTASGMLFGYLSDRIGFRGLFAASFLLASPCLLLLVWAEGPWVYPLIFLSGFFIMATLPLGVTLAQTLAPKGRSMVSSLMMGFAFGLGGTMTPIAGAFADAFSIRPVLAAVAVIPLALLVFVSRLPEPGKTC
ncbi:MAG: MFS transporter [Syntrophaceae bacterium]|nr:MFS transporter [Syntrophaceae bacterium]